MKMIALKEVRIIKPPFRGTIAEMVEWVKPTTVSVKGNLIVGGLLAADRALITTGCLKGDIVKVQFTDDRVVEGVHAEYSNKMFLSYYGVHEEDAVKDWVGIPNRTDVVCVDSFLFSYVHDHEKDYVVQFRPIADPRAFQGSGEEGYQLHLDACERHHSYPVVDMYGYLVGINLGSCDGEVICQSLQLKGAKL